MTLMSMLIGNQKKNAKNKMRIEKKGIAKGRH